MTDAVTTAEVDRQDEALSVWLPLRAAMRLAFGVGGMTDLRWKNFYQTMQSAGIYPKGLDVTKAYDLRFMRRSLQNYR